MTASDFRMDGTICGHIQRDLIPITIIQTTQTVVQIFSAVLRPLTVQRNQENNMSRAKTAEEAQAEFLQAVRGIAQQWADVPHHTVQERCEGVAFSILSLVDGTSVGFPSLDLVLRPHEEDRQFAIDNGDDWYSDGQVINESYLHEQFYTSPSGSSTKPENPS